MIALDEARALLLADVRPLPAEAVAVDEALGRVLARPLVAAFDQPQLPLSAMDGWAVCAQDAVEGARLAHVGDAFAGAPFAGRVGRGQAVRIATGGVVPAGAEHVVMQEIVRRDGDAIVIAGRMHDSHFVRPAGGDFCAGDRLLEPGDTMTAARLGLAAAANAATIEVVKRPLVRIFASGDELRRPGEALAAGHVIDSAGVALSALVTQWGGIAERGPTLPDDQERAKKLVEQSRTADLLLFIGGASVGDRDVLRAVIADLGASLSFDRVAVQPGKPSWHARFGDGRMVLGLPGNPASAFVCAHLLLEPLLAAWLGRASLCRPRPARLCLDIPASAGREIYWRATLDWNETGCVLVTPDLRGDSSLQRPLAGANALLRQPAGSALSKGALVEVIALPGSAGA